MDWTTVIALYGAAVATASVAWTIYVWHRDKYELLLTVHVEQIFDRLRRAKREKEDTSPRYEMIFRIINHGRRPATIVDLGFEYEGEATNDGMPRIYREYTGPDRKRLCPFILQLGAWHESRFPAAASKSELETSLGKTPGRLRWWAKDAKGRIYISDFCWPWYEK